MEICVEGMETSALREDADCEAINCEFNDRQPGSH